MFTAYYISTGHPIAKWTAISCKRNSLWRRAFFSRCLVNGDLVVTFEGDTDETYVSPHATHGIMVRNY